MGSTDFDVIESNKENVIPLKDGRSASSLVEGLQATTESIQSRKITFERRLIEDLENMDDPLELFLEYISWTNHVFPQGGTSKKSDMLDILERCLLYFKDIETYYNDPRYLKIWLWYIELYCSMSFTEAKDVYIYMLRKGIGIKLSLLYEEFSQLLYDNDYYSDALEMLKLGLQENSRPTKRLEKRLESMESDLINNNININNPLYSKLDLNNSNLPKLVLGKEGNDIITNGENIITNTHIPIQNKSKQKYTIFHDDPEERRTDNLTNGLIRQNPSNNLQSKSQRTKENKLLYGQINASSNLGKIKQEDAYAIKLLKNSKKLPIFQDTLGRSGPIYKILEVPGKKKEVIDCNFDLIYHPNGEEFCFEELLAISRNIYNQPKPTLTDSKRKYEKPSDDELNHGEIQKKRAINVLSEKPSKIPVPSQNIKKKIEVYHEPIVPSKTTSSNKTNIYIDHKSEDYQSPNTTSNREYNLGYVELKNPLMTKEYAETDEENNMPLEVTKPTSHYHNVTETVILPLNDTVKQRNEEGIEPPGSPTVTFFSKDAINEVYSMFNQNYKEESNNEATGRLSIYDNMTQDLTKQNLDDLTEVKMPPENINNKDNIEQTENKLSHHSNEENTYYNSLERENNSEFGNKEYPMTPIKENTEQNVISEGKSYPDNLSTLDSQLSSPFLTQPERVIRHESNAVFDSPHMPINDVPNVVTDPLNESWRRKLLSTIDPPLETYNTLFRYEKALQMSSTVKKTLLKSKANNNTAMIDFKRGNGLYCIRSILGEGGYATVYLAESSIGTLNALKVEKPHNIWEFYILSQIKKRLAGNDEILRSIITVSALHYFIDESYLVLNYASQGTLLDLLNLYRQKSQNSFDEELAMFFTIEIMKLVENLHSIGIIHADLKLENCMVRFISGELGDYNADGHYGWQNKGIYLIDFGRSFDMTLLPSDTKFIANWKITSQDCYEMQQKLPWNYQADYYNIVSIINLMLFGVEMKTTVQSDGTIKLASSFKRYWQQDIWREVFTVLLNSSSYGTFPITSKIQKLRNILESYLINEGSKKLRTIIRDIESDLHMMGKKKV